MANRNTHYLVRNINGTSKIKCWCRNWIAHWRSVTGKMTPTCSCLGCSRAGEVGAHVQIVDARFYREWYIVPLCKGHNHYRNTDTMFVKRSTELVPASVSQTCGRADWWL